MYNCGSNAATNNRAWPARLKQISLSQPMIPTPHSNLELGNGTHPGETGKNNEDHWSVSSYYGAGGEIVTLAVIADGVGGNNAGEVASALAAKTVTEFVAKSYTENYPQILA